jgi:hypothetical protein
VLLTDCGWRVGVKPKVYFHTINDGGWVLKKVDGLKQVLHKQEQNLNPKIIILENIKLTVPQGCHIIWPLYVQGIIDSQ